MSDEKATKTREQLLAEIAALQEELARRGSDSASPVPEGGDAPVFSAPITRRKSLVSWVAPVILALPVVQAVGMVWKSGTAYAAATKAPIARTGRCIVVPSAAPSAAPTAAPTLGLGAAPDSRPSPGLSLVLGDARGAIRVKSAA